VRTNNGHLPHDRSPSNSPHVPLASTPANDAWHSTEDAPDSANGQLKRKRSITPTTQTQHHHLAAHEAAMGAASMPSQHQTPQQRSGDDAMSGADEDGRSVRDVTLEDGSPHPQGIHIDPHTGIRVDPKRRKRVFSNRTKTGCITCRRRKKKCDEGKPEC
jgi:ferric-dicitrate binding protein FerR (iron transport regulator)